jgi:large subunit ribosomal protein L17
MRHGDKINNLGRTMAHRQALLMNLACALIENKRIFTTLAKAKALRTYVEPIINKSKDDSTHSRRLAFSYLKNKDAVITLFKDVAGKVADRKGGYTRIIKTGNRHGDAAEMAMIELVDFNELYNNKKSTDTAAKKTTRRGRSKTKAKAGEKGAEEKKAEE